MPPHITVFPEGMLIVAFVKWVIAGAIGGAAGAAIWALISYAAHAEVGWIAWGIGFVVGACVRVAAGEQHEGFLPGLTAAVIAILSVVAGKYAAVSYAVSAVNLDQVAVTFTDEELIVGLADEIIEAREAKGQKVQLPGGKSIEDAKAQADYPPAIWREASQKWQSLGPAGQKQRRESEEARVRELVGALSGQLHQSAFASSFSPFDALWFILAALSAYKLGHGNIASSDD
jgi:hypothetical protein